MMKQPGEMSDVAVFSRMGEEEQLYFSLYDTDIKPSIALNRNGLEYDLIIPFTRISNGGLNEISLLSVGVETKSASMNSGQQGGPGGQGGGQGGPGGGPGGPGPGGGPGGMDQSSMANPVKIWFRVILQK
jgi:hypothetical protein